MCPLPDTALNHDSRRVAVIIVVRAHHRPEASSVLLSQQLTPQPEPEQQEAQVNSGCAGSLCTAVSLQQAELCVALRVAHQLCNLYDFHPSLQGNLGLRFQHPAPVQPGVLGNIGWREEENLARQGQEAATAAPAAAAAVAAPKAAANGGLAMYTMEEVEQHASEESAWFVHEGKVGTEATKARDMIQYLAVTQIACSQQAGSLRGRTIAAAAPCVIRHVVGLTALGTISGSNMRSVCAVLHGYG